MNPVIEDKLFTSMGIRFAQTQVVSRRAMRVHCVQFYIKIIFVAKSNTTQLARQRMVFFFFFNSTLIYCIRIYNFGLPFRLVRPVTVIKTLRYRHCQLCYIIYTRIISVTTICIA